MNLDFQRKKGTPSVLNYKTINELESNKQKSAVRP